MKWIVALIGALLSLAGGNALYQGLSIIQVERGWATFIAGAVLLGAGVIVIAIAALMGRVDRLADLYEETLALAEEEEVDAEPAKPAAVPVIEEAPRRAEPAPAEAAPPQPVAPSHVAVIPEPLAPEPPPPPPRDFVVAQPAYVAPRAYSEPPASPEPEPEAVPEPVAEARPAALRDFQFVFPSEPLTGPPAREPEREPEPETVAEAEPVEAEAASNVGWLRRAREARAERERKAETAQIWAPPPGFEEQTQVAETPSLAGDNFDDQAAEAATADQEPASPPLPQADEPPLSPPRAAEAEADPFGSQWLERALAEADEAGHEALAAPPAARRPPPPFEGEAAEPQDAPHRYEGAELEPEVVLQAPPPPLRNGAAAPVEIGRYRANNVAYVMFSDGSITADTPAGKSYRFDSLKELRAFIERGDM